MTEITFDSKFDQDLTAFEGEFGWLLGGVGQVLLEVARFFGPEFERFLRGICQETKGKLDRFLGGEVFAGT